MLHLVLAADCSASVTFDEFNLIASGTAAALRDPSVAAGLAQGSLAAVLLFSGAASQDVVIGWTPLASPKAVARFADAVENMPRALTPGLTASGEALAAAAALLARAPAPTGRRVIDIVGDGRANDGTPPGPVRDRLAAEGITINALCLLHEEPDFVEYATRELIGGPGAFAQPCADDAGFRDAMRRKLLREISDTPVA